MNLALPTIIVISIITALLSPHELQCEEQDRSSSDPAPQTVVPQSAASDHSPKSVVQSGSHTSPPLKYSLTIFVDKGAGELNGHVFVKLSDGKNNLYRGFYANEAVTDEFGKATAAVRVGGGQIRDDANHTWDVSRTYNIAKSGFENALRAVEEIRKTGPSWWVNNHCGDFAEGVANAAGVPLHLPWTATGRDRPSIFGEYLLKHGGKQRAAANESKSKLQLEVEDLYGQLVDAKQKESNAHQAVEKSEHALQLASELDDSQAKSVAQEALSISKEALTKDRQNRESLESKLHQACNKARVQVAGIKANEGEQKTIEMCQKN